MYTFIDTTETQGSESLPSEALEINGSYIENEITGYRTLYVSGRECMAPELTTTETQNRDGVRLTGWRYPARTITVGYQIVAASAADFREKYNKLGYILNHDNARLIFADETDKYLRGAFSGMGEVDPGRNAVTGEFEFTCVDPFKYSVSQLVATSSSGYISVTYNGAHKTYPTIKATITSAGHVTFSMNGALLKFGSLSSGDSLEVDCSDGTVTRNGVVTLGLGALANEWESFYLQRGANTVTSSASGTQNFQLYYRERWL